MGLGKDEKWILEQARKTRQPIPEEFATAPDLYAGLDIFYLAFMDLTSCRELGHGTVGPISWQVVQLYCNEYEILGEQREDMFYFLLKMDEAYLEYSHDRAREQIENRKNA